MGTGPLGVLTACWVGVELDNSMRFNGSPASNVQPVCRARALACDAPYSVATPRCALMAMSAFGTKRTLRSAVLTTSSPPV
jgi:hypothetical protein